MVLPATPCHFKKDCCSSAPSTCCPPATSDIAQLEQQISCSMAQIKNMIRDRQGCCPPPPPPCPPPPSCGASIVPCHTTAECANLKSFAVEGATDTCCDTDEDYTLTYTDPDGTVHNLCLDGIICADAILSSEKCDCQDPHFEIRMFRNLPDTIECNTECHTALQVLYQTGPITQPATLKIRIGRCTYASVCLTSLCITSYKLAMVKCKLAEVVCVTGVQSDMTVGGKMTHCDPNLTCCTSD